MSDFGRLRSYGRFLIPVHALVWTASNSWCTRDALLARIMDAADVIRSSALKLLARFTTERQPVLRPAVAFSKTNFKHR